MVLVQGRRPRRPTKLSACAGKVASRPAGQARHGQHNGLVRCQESEPSAAHPQSRYRRSPDLLAGR